MRTRSRTILAVLLVAAIGLAAGCRPKTAVLEETPLPEESHPAVTVGKSVALSSLKSAVMTSQYPVVDDVASCNGTVVFSAGTGKAVPNDAGSATVNHVAAWNTKTAKIAALAAIHDDGTKHWSRIMDLQASDAWVLFTVLCNPGEIPSECYAFNRTTNKLTQLLKDYSWPAEDLNKNTVVIPIFGHMLLQNDYAYLVLTRETMFTDASKPGSGASFSSLDGVRIIRVNLTTGKVQTIFESKLGSFCVYTVWALDHDSVAFSASSLTDNGDSKDQLLIYSPATGMSKPIPTSQWKDAADPNNIGLYVITPDSGIIYASGKKVVIARLATPTVTVETTIPHVSDAIPYYVFASDDYLVAKTEAGDIFVVNRHTGEGTTITGASVTGDFALQGSEISFVRRTEGANDRIVYLNLDENRFDKVGGPTQTLAAEKVVRDFFMYWNEKNIPEMEKRMTPDRKGIEWNIDVLKYVKLISITEQKPVELGTKAFVVVFDISGGASVNEGINSWNYELKRKDDTSLWLIFDWGHGGGLLR
jgi:hypothetical protein